MQLKAERTATCYWPNGEKAEQLITQPPALLDQRIPREMQHLNEVLGLLTTTLANSGTMNVWDPVALAFAQIGHVEAALFAAEQIADLAGRAQILVGIANHWVQTGELSQLSTVLHQAFVITTRLQCDDFFATLGAAAPALAGLDQGETLWQLCKAVEQIETWWSAEFMLVVA